MEPPENTEVFQTRTLRCWLREDGLLYSTFISHSDIDLPQVKENMDALWQAGKQEKIPLLGDIREIHSVTKRARSYAKEEMPKKFRAIALLVGNPLSRIIGNFVVVFDKPAVPMKMFTSEEFAVGWLKGFLDE